MASNGPPTDPPEVHNEETRKQALNNLMLQFDQLSTGYPGDPSAGLQIVMQELTRIKSAATVLRRQTEDPATKTRPAASTPTTRTHPIIPLPLPHDQSAALPGNTWNLALAAWNRQKKGLRDLEREIEVLSDFLHQQIEALISSGAVLRASSTAKVPSSGHGGPIQGGEAVEEPQSQQNVRWVGGWPVFGSPPVEDSTAFRDTRSAQLPASHEDPALTWGALSEQQPPQASDAQHPSWNTSSAWERQNQEQVNEGSRLPKVSPFPRVKQPQQDNATQQMSADPSFAWDQQPEQTGVTSQLPAKPSSGWDTTIEQNMGSTVATDAVNTWEETVVGRTSHAQSQHTQSAAATNSVSTWESNVVDQTSSSQPPVTQAAVATPRLDDTGGRTLAEKIRLSSGEERDKNGNWVKKKST